jgi:hypothetical protein
MSSNVFISDCGNVLKLQGKMWATIASANLCENNDTYVALHEHQLLASTLTKIFYHLEVSSHACQKKARKSILRMGQHYPVIAHDLDHLEAVSQAALVRQEKLSYGTLQSGSVH